MNKKTNKGIDFREALEAQLEVMRNENSHFRSSLISDLISAEIDKQIVEYQAKEKIRKQKKTRQKKKRKKKNRKN